MGYKPSKYENILEDTAVFLSLTGGCGGVCAGMTYAIGGLMQTGSADFAKGAAIALSATYLLSQVNKYIKES